MGIRFYQEKDEESIQQLFAKVFGKNRSHEHWYWKYKQHPQQENPWILVCEQKDRIIGHIALWVNEVYINGAKKKAGMRIDTMVDPDARGKGVYQQLNQAMLKEAKRADIALLYGFPAPKARELLLAHTGAQQVGWMPRYIYITNPIAVAASWMNVLRPLKPFGAIYRLVLPKRNSQQLPQSWKIEHISECDDRFTQLAEQTANTRPVMANRDKKYLNWRYHQHPDNDYTMLAISGNDGLLGYIVTKQELKQFKKGNIQIGTIVDWLAVEDGNVWDALIRIAANHLQACDLLQSWAFPDTPGAATLEAAGFKEKDRPLALVIHQLGDIDTGKKTEDWMLSQGDVDSF
ncbi:GNAT family N-acetyltransferase [Sediminibacillus albus]|uniref:Predicted N-acetyltransferase YhbS n=1 Tax=Sediminibacillus albus TaxID=407036 RepID=A0A1G8ZGY6_9BACI|nr:GNAT family N-acetyltransferase [Sediminibacillus albus]SDK14298.1 Predicted N-acetyltransferase YhbS [Sediminibacillus albus]